MAANTHRQRDIFSPVPQELGTNIPKATPASKRDQVVADLEALTFEQYYEAHKEEIQADAKKQRLIWNLYLALSVGGGAAVTALHLLIRFG